MSAKDRLVFVGTSDMAGLVRGKSFPKSEWDKRVINGVGWTPTNIQLTCFDTISDSPFGPFGDLALVPDPATKFTIDEGEPPLEFAIGDIRDLEGEPWAFCARALARRAIEELHQISGATPLAAFEHEFQLTNKKPLLGDAYGFKGFRDGQNWAEAYLNALRQTTCIPDTFMKEYGPAQYEITLKPAKGIGAADNAVIVRLLARDVLKRFDVTPSFSPMLDPDSVGNGVHIHFSFLDDAGRPITHDASDPHGMSRLTRHFIGGVLKHLDQIIAILAPSDISYYRLIPHRWSAAFNNLGYRDREASVRICPTFSTDDTAIARQFNFEVRAIDAAASPYLAFAAIVFAGTQGVKDQTEPPAPTEQDLALLETGALAKMGLKRLPQSLSEALDLFSASRPVRDWFGDEFVELYNAHKQGELAQLDGLDGVQKCQKYKDVY